MSTKKLSKSSSEQPLKSFADHLGELRTRLAWVALVFIAASALAYNVREQLVSIVLAPIGNQQLVYLTPAGGFAFIFQIALYAGMLATAPVAVYQLYKFVSPALPEQMRKRSVLIVFVSTLLMSGGVAFGYFVAIPAALQFLTTFAGGFIQPNLTADSYLSFVIAYVLGLGLLFQLPLLLVLWNWIQPFKPGGLLATQRYVLVGSFVAAAVITPTPDVINQCLIAVPIVGIYQLGVVAVYVMNKKQRKRIVRRVSVPTRQMDTLDKPIFALSSSATTALPPRQPLLSQQVSHPSVARGSGSVDGFNQRRSGVAPAPVRQRRPIGTTARRQLVRPTGRQSSVNVDGFAFVRSN